MLGRAVRKRGLTALSFDLADSTHFDIRSGRAFEWLLWVIQANSVGFVFVAPPCTDFSAAKHPQTRSYARPGGIPPVSEKTHRATALARRFLAIFRAAVQSRVSCVFEQPFLSKMCWLPEWTRLASLAGVRQYTPASCAYISKEAFQHAPYLKRFRMLAGHVGTRGSLLDRGCPGDHVHVPLAGRAAALSARYNGGLVEALGEVIAGCVEDRRTSCLGSHPRKGSERPSSTNS